MCPTDADGDGYGVPTTAGCPAVPDCNDQDEAIGPDAAEVVGNGVDEDCDRNDAVAHRADVRSFMAPQWAWTGAVSWNGDTVTVGGQGESGSLTRVLNRYVPFGQLRAVVGVEALSGSTCALDVESAQAGSAPVLVAYPITATGTIVSSPLPLHSAPRTVTRLTLRCAAGASAQIDWLTLANAPSAAGPLAEATAAWTDIDAPAGGLATSVVRVPKNVSGGSGVTDGAWMASDVGGVARLDEDSMEWTTANGTGATGLTNQGALSVWDVLPSTYDGTTYLLSGRYTDDTCYSGGFWQSLDDGPTWTALADSNDDDAGLTTDDVGGRGRYGFCSDKPYSGGALMAEEEDSTTVYIGNGDPDQLGVWLFDGSDLCELPDAAAALPTDGHVRALLRTRTPIFDQEALIVGFAAREPSDPSLYLCTLPEIDTGTATVIDGEKMVTGPPDLLGDLVTLTCSGPEEAACAPIAGSEGLDVRDLERDPLLTEMFYVASSGLDETCTYTDVGTICKDALGDHEIPPLGGTGREFSVAQSALLTAETWGNLVDLKAVDNNVAFALFSTGSTGRLVYTIDGGGTWTQVTYSGSWTNGSTNGTCTEATFFAKAKGLALVLPGTTTVGVDTDGLGGFDTIDGTVYVASRYNSSYTASSTANSCGLAKVTLDNGTATWAWTPLQRSYTQTECQIDEGNILGVSSPPWTPSAASGPVAYVWGVYTYVKTPATHLGGACVISATGADTQLVSPATYPMTVRDVAPSDSTVDWLFVAGNLDVNTQLEVWKYGAGLTDYPTYPLLVDTSTSTPSVLELTTAPPNLVGLAGGWGADATTGDPLLLYGTEGSGAWRGFLTW